MFGQVLPAAADEASADDGTTTFPRAHALVLTVPDLEAQGAYIILTGNVTSSIKRRPMQPDAWAAR